MSETDPAKNELDSSSDKKKLDGVAPIGDGPATPPSEGPKTTVPLTSPAAAKQKSAHHLRKSLIIKLSVAGVIGVLLIGIIAIKGWGWIRSEISKPFHIASVKVNVPPATVADPLTGAQVTPEVAAQPVVGVMIENLYPDARPQSGLGAAGIVYEALAEGGITRFLAIFQEPLPPSIGPVRSLRPYYLDWGLEYNIPVAHAGGSQPALAAIKPLGLKDINALVYDGSAFYRAKDRFAPHNLYTSDQRLASLLTRLGFATAPNFTPWPRKKDAPLATPTHPNITINFSTSAYVAQYHYDAIKDAYARVLAGTPHVDRNTGQQIVVKNVVVEYVPTTYGTQPNGKPETDYHLIGSGQALIFTDGGLTTATWNKTSAHAQTTLTDASGKPVALNVGNTWFDVVPTGASVVY